MYLKNILCSPSYAKNRLNNFKAEIQLFHLPFSLNLSHKEKEREIDTDTYTQRRDTYREKEREGRRGRKGCRGRKETPLSVAITFSRGGAFLGG